ncbi:hypothetical protein A3A66_00495 [Microgenomates group bacterium RIFCSPLOWO2_01_FULL_46_13]|nr:MAG: hypothetical protein A2783_03770 [Microgenomates group bacterium RIFCSPHIGHO2_01_FULL_45_11]OGV94492.1 MAG: hypothetical protein A3A66_00495 [Microgenomates group bacterium RIFCSPLOWO2_01_FULL_46_13]
MKNGSVESDYSGYTESFDVIKQRSVMGVLAYLTRTFLVQMVGIVATLILAALLDPEAFGTFFLVTAVVNLFVFLSDVGLAASLIQKKEQPTRADLVTTFTIQQLLASFIFVVIVGLTPFWRQALHLNSAGLFLMYALGFSFILASFKTIPSILLERRLEFNKLVLPQIVENVVFYAGIVYFAWRGYGVSSYTVAVLLRGVVGVIAMYVIEPWRLGLGVSTRSLKELLHFGLPYQVNDLLARIKDDLLFVVLRGVVSITEMGYIGWAKKWSLFPFRFTVDSVVRVTFPAYSRLQKDKRQLKKALEKSLFFISLAVFPLMIGMLGMAYPLTIVVTAYQKWQPALPALYFFIVDVSCSAVVVPLTNVLNATGKIRTTLKLMVGWTVLLWILTLWLTKMIGYTGVAVATALVGISSLVVVEVVRRKISFQFWNNVLPALMAASFMGFVLWRFQAFASQSLTRFLTVVITGVMAYGIFLGLFLGKRLVMEIKSIWSFRK